MKNWLELVDWTAVESAEPGEHRIALHRTVHGRLVAQIEPRGGKTAAMIEAVVVTALRGERVAIASATPEGEEALVARAKQAVAAAGADPALVYGARQVPARGAGG